MATVRIYKVAELLGTTSQEVTALLKRDHGIEVKSASSTIEEVVARQFVDRLARQRNIALPTAIFSPKRRRKGGKKNTPAKKAPSRSSPSRLPCRRRDWSRPSSRRPLRRSRKRSRVAVGTGRAKRRTAPAPRRVGAGTVSPPRHRHQCAH